MKVNDYGKIRSYWEKEIQSINKPKLNNKHETL